MSAGEKSGVMDDEKHGEEIDEHDERRRPRGKTQNDENGADAVGKKRVGETGMGADMNGIGKMLDHDGVAGELFEPMLQEEAETGKNTE